MKTHNADLDIANLTLARRLERAEAHGNAEFVEARAQAFPDSGAEWIEVAGAYAMYDGLGSPCTQTFGLGLFDPITDAEMQRLEEFFQQRGAEVFHEVSPLADALLPALLVRRGYQPLEFSNVLFRPLGPARADDLSPGETIHVRRIEAGEQDLWARTAAQGWSDVVPELFDDLLELGKINANRRNTHCFLAETEGKAVAAAAICLFEGVALLAGASTVPEWRRRGAQSALLEQRLCYGIEQGCDIAMVVAQPGSASQRNAQRRGFRVAYTRLKWRLATTTASS